MTTVTTNKQQFKDNNSINGKRATQIGIITVKPVTNRVIDYLDSKFKNQRRWIKTYTLHTA